MTFVCAACERASSRWSGDRDGASFFFLILLEEIHFCRSVLFSFFFSVARSTGSLLNVSSEGERGKKEQLLLSLSPEKLVARTRRFCACFIGSTSPSCPVLAMNVALIKMRGATKLFSGKLCRACLAEPGSEYQLAHSSVAGRCPRPLSFSFFFCFLRIV